MSGTDTEISVDFFKVGRCCSVFPWKSRWSVRFRCLYMCTKCHCMASITYSFSLWA